MNQKQLLTLGIAGTAITLHIGSEIRTNRQNLDLLSRSSKGRNEDVIGVHWTTQDSVNSIVNDGPCPGIFIDDSKYGVAYYGVATALVHIPKAVGLTLSGEFTAARQSITPRAVAFVKQDDISLEFQPVDEYLKKTTFSPLDGSDIRLPVFPEGSFDVGSNLIGLYLTKQGLLKVRPVDPILESTD